MKKLFSLFVALIVATSLFASDIQVDGIWYDFDDTKLTASVTYRGSNYYDYDNEYTGSVVIPASVSYHSKTYSVTTIGNDAFRSCSNLTSVTIPNSVTTIEKRAFLGCRGLTSVTIPNFVTTIGEYAFEYCSGLTSVTISNSVTTIGDSAFYKCRDLTSVTIPNSVITIGAGAFSNCSGLTSVTIPNSVTTVGYLTFYGCSGLISVTIPNSVITIGDGAFYGCSGLTSVTIPNSVITIGMGTFFGCSGLTSVMIGNSVTTIGSSAFSGCSGLTSVTIGNSVTMVGDYAFDGCKYLFDIYCYAPMPPAAQPSSFANYNVFLHVPCDNLRVYQTDIVFGSFKYIECISAEEKPITGDEVTVNPSTDNATFTWPANPSADGYSLEITKDGVVFCTLKFNAQGQLTGIAFAPSRDGAREMASAEMTASGWQFTVTGLNQGSKYGYTLDVLNASQQSIKHYEGEFTTTGGISTDLYSLPNDEKGTLNSKFIIHNSLYLFRNGKMYNAIGGAMR